VYKKGNLGISTLGALPNAFKIPVNGYNFKRRLKMRRVFVLAVSLVLVSNCLALNQPMLELEQGRGDVLRFVDLSLSRPGAAFSSNEGGVAFGSKNAEFVENYQGQACYRITGNCTSRHSLALKPNRNYLVSVLLNCDFERADGRAKELNIIMRTYDGSGKNVVDTLKGVPNKTYGWQRWEYEFTANVQAMHGRLNINAYWLDDDDKIYIADIALIELPPKSLTPYYRGEGVTFPDGPGNLPMKVEEAKADEAHIMVRTTGARFDFDLKNDTISGRQMIGRERDIAVAEASTTLQGMRILSKTDTECVLGNDKMTIGVQCDSLVMIVPHEEMIFEFTSKIGGKWNRLGFGHLLACDGIGGFAVNPDIPLGSGRLPRVTTEIRTGRVSKTMWSGLDFCNTVDNKHFISSAKPGWQISWAVIPGERLAFSVFPPRPYPWKESFRTHWCSGNVGWDLDDYKNAGKTAEIALLWSFLHRGWGQSFNIKFTPYDEDVLTQHTAWARQASMRPIIYASPYFYAGRKPSEFVAEAERLRDEYNLDGLYYDGIPGQQWVEAYEEMRMTREVFADGILILHNTGHASNGGPPLQEPTLKIPAVETYADATYGGELVFGVGQDWVYPKYIESQYGLANCIGTMVRGRRDRPTWTGLSFKQKDYVMLLHNGRSNTRAYYDEVVRKLEQLWQETGDDPDFYEKYYKPKVIELTEDVLSQPYDPAKND